MSLKAFIAREWWFTPVSQKKDEIPEAQRAQYLLGIPDATGCAAIEDMGNVKAAGPLGEEVLRRPTGTMHLLGLKYGLRGWKNHMAPTGQQAEFLPVEDGICPMENIEIIHPRLRGELGEEILKAMYLSDDDRKN